MSEPICPRQDLAIHTLTADQSSHLVVVGERSVLIECHSSQLPRWWTSRGLPAPEMVLHTHIQPEHCREGGVDGFGDAKVMVHEELVELASDRAAWEKAAHTTWDHPEDWPQTMGQEKYGVAGAITVLPPDQPLTVGGTFKAGDEIPFGELTFRVIDLPGHSRHHVGFVLEDGGKPLAVFTGDLLTDPACLVNLYDLEYCYGGLSLPKLPAVLRELCQVGCDLFFPATGTPMTDGPSQARTLADKIDAYLEAQKWAPDDFQPTPMPELRKTGRYVQHGDGVFQITNFGNVILLIDELGHGLMIDPGPCDFEKATRDADFIADLEHFEKHHHLEAIDLVLITHMHGDHYDLTHLVQQRYPGCRVAAWDVVARVIEAPWDYPYSALLPWYNLGVEAVKVDDVLKTGQPYFWHGVEIQSDHLPGHCYAHGVHWLEFRGQRLAITGDTIQSRGGADGLSFILSNDSVPDDKRGCEKAYRNMLHRPVDLNLGGHGSHFINCRAQYEASLARIEHAQPFLKALVPNGDLTRACHRSWYPQLNPVS